MKLLLDLIQTPIFFAVDPLGTIEKYPLNVLIWVGTVVWVVIRHRKLKKQKKVCPDDKNKMQKLY